ncbi:MAG: SRPBCC family protein [Austwickia sp.]|jgi:carbon monoxide dehydrogenase subunit G|nr:MAG: SRPBCC family protein [Austwickia sp.]
MIRAAAESAASPAALWSVVADLDRWADHLPTVTAIRHVGGQEPAGVGSRYRVRQPGLPPTTYEITHWEPGTGFTWVARSPGLVSTARHRVEPRGAGSVLELAFGWSGPMGGVVRRLFAGKGRAYVEREADTFARLAERR